MEAERLTLGELQALVDRWIGSTGAGYFSALTNMAVLTEEIGEVARVIARTDGDQRPKASDTLDLADELADVLWVVAAIANQHSIDLAEAMSNNLAKKNVRDSERFRTATKARGSIETN